MISREDQIERSISTYLRQQLYDVRNYPSDRVEILDAYPDEKRMQTPLAKVNYVAIGYAADDGGRDAELGSPARVRKYTYDFFVFAISRVWGRNLATVIRNCMESDLVVPILDPASEEVVDALQVDFASSQQIISQFPRPWQENAWVTRVRVIDEYYSSALGG